MEYYAKFVMPEMGVDGGWVVIMKIGDYENRVIMKMGFFSLGWKLQRFIQVILRNLGFF